jgi:hypothetical protein
VSEWENFLFGRFPATETLGTPVLDQLAMRKRLALQKWRFGKWHEMKKYWAFHFVRPITSPAKSESLAGSVTV